jgi:hypothetical protein
MFNKSAGYCAVALGVDQFRLAILWHLSVIQKTQRRRNTDGQCSELPHHLAGSKTPLGLCGHRPHVCRLEASVTWGALNVSRAADELRNPVYADIYAYDRTGHVRIG